MIARLLTRLSLCGWHNPRQVLLASLILTLVATDGLLKLGLNTEIARLLPAHSQASMWTEKLHHIVGDGGFFTILLTGEDRSLLTAAVEQTATLAARLPGVALVNHTYPTEFIHTYRYLLIPDSSLEKIHDHVLAVKARISPFNDDLLQTSPEREGVQVRREREELYRLFNQYANLSHYHESPDGKTMGVVIRTRPDLDNIDDLYQLLAGLRKISDQVAKQHGVWSGVGGSQIHNLQEYEIIRRDLARAGAITLVAIVIVLILSFRSLTVLPVLLYPLGVGMVWAFSLVPPVLGDLNIISSFLLVVLFGLGIDFSIHLVKRFQQERGRNPGGEAIVATFTSTGMSVLVSGLTTGVALLVLWFSDFRGFSEFGLIGGATMLIIVVAMLVVMPACLRLADRFSVLPPSTPRVIEPRRLPLWSTRSCLLLLPICLLAAITVVRFDYDFNGQKPQVENRQRFEAANKAVYRTKYMSPGAVFLAPDLSTLDQLLGHVEDQIGRQGSTFLKVDSIRTFVPTDDQVARRKARIGEIQEELQGRWLDKIEDPLLHQWAGDFRNWQPPPDAPALDQLPQSLLTTSTAGETPRYYLAGIYPNLSRSNGQSAMAFARQIYDLERPSGVLGPVGEMVVFAEILWTVTGEGPWVVIAAFCAVFGLLAIGTRSFSEMAWISMPLLAGLIFTMGAMALLGLRFNFYNVVVFPALVGMGVDAGIHYYRRWRELGCDGARCYGELFAPLSVCTLTSMMGYSGMVFATHPGLRSIGQLACLGLACIWVASLLFFPGLLHLVYPKIGSEQRG